MAGIEAATDPIGPTGVRDARMDAWQRGSSMQAGDRRACGSADRVAGRSDGAGPARRECSTVGIITHVH
jgi:hypothetical protein